MVVLYAKRWYIDVHHSSPDLNSIAQTSNEYAL